jgi:hypothetical protein
MCIKFYVVINHKYTDKVYVRLTFICGLNIIDVAMVQILEVKFYNF